MDRICRNIVPMDGDRMDVLEADLGQPRLSKVSSVRSGMGPFLALSLCALGYCSFHLLRPALSTLLSPEWFLFDGIRFIHGSFPSFLLGLAMVASTGLAPSILFHSQKQRFVILSAALLTAAFWFEFIIPQFVPTSVGSWADCLAMVLGGSIAIWLLDNQIACVSDTKIKQPKNSPISSQQSVA